MFELNENEPQALVHYLRRRKWLTPSENIKLVSVPGEGNMNYVLRVDTGERTFIIKQSRAYVEKYPQVAAPANRAVIEGRFYQTISTTTPLKQLMPALIGMDSKNHVLALEDLGVSSDFTFLYQLNEKLNRDTVSELVNYLNQLHTNFQKKKEGAVISNLKMRKLNYEHIFIYPFMEENGFELDRIQPGLQELAKKYKEDEHLKKRILNLGKVYLSNGNTLLHGDFYPGSWLKTEIGIRIIDPEFCFYGCKEFDLAVMIAHLYLTEHDERLIESVIEGYYLKNNLNTTLLNQFVGVEIMRRLIGLAQLPLKADLAIKEKLLEKAYSKLVQ